MAGRKGRSGRKKSITALVNEALERVDECIPELFNKLIEKGLQGDRECLIYLIDRRLGKPKVISGYDEEDRDLLKAQTVVEFFRLVRRESLQLKEGGSKEG